MKSKKGLSLMVSYTLLVIIAISLSIIVYPYLKTRIPPQSPECPTDTSLVVEHATCTIATDSRLVVMLANRGLFNVSAVYVRFDQKHREVKDQINANNETLSPPIGPGEVRIFNYSLPYIPQQEIYMLEIQPGILKKRILTPCKSVITYPVNCTA